MKTSLRSPLLAGCGAGTDVTYKPSGGDESRVAQTRTAAMLIPRPRTGIGEPFPFWFGGGKIAGRRCDLRREDMPSGSRRCILVGGSAERTGPAQARGA